MNLKLNHTNRTKPTPATTKAHIHANTQRVLHNTHIPLFSHQIFTFFFIRCQSKIIRAIYFILFTRSVSLSTRTLLSLALALSSPSFYPLQKHTRISFISNRALVFDIYMEKYYLHTHQLKASLNFSCCRKRAYGKFTSLLLFPFIFKWKKSEVKKWNERKICCWYFSLDLLLSC